MKFPGKIENHPGDATWLSQRAVVEFAAVLTLVLVAIHTEGVLRWTVVPLVLAGALSRRARLHAALWFALGGIRLIGQIPLAWYAIDNHQYLLTYWCFALALVLAGSRQSAVLRVNARLLVGLAFCFATIWKVISPDFLDGSLFHFILVSEDRAITFTGPMFDVAPPPPEAFQHLGAMRSGYAAPAAVPMPHSGDLDVWPVVLSWTTLIIEAVVAVAFLAPLRSRAWFRDAALLVFLWTTYLLAPVVGFGMLLAAMGYSQAAGPGSRRLYLVTFPALPVAVALAAVGRLPPSVWIVLVGAVGLVAYLLWSKRPLLIPSCVILGAGAGASFARGTAGVGTITGIGVGLLLVALIDLAGQRPPSQPLIVAGGLFTTVGGSLWLL